LLNSTAHLMAQMAAFLRMYALLLSSSFSTSGAKSRAISAVQAGPGVESLLSKTRQHSANCAHCAGRARPGG
jgi:hypothetical protein